MPTNASTFNSRVTSEALEKKFRDTFPAQGGAELVQDLYAQGVIVPTVDFTAAAQGSELASYLQTAWDFSSGHASQGSAGSQTIINNTGFWKIETTTRINVSLAVNAQLRINNGLTNQVIYEIKGGSGSSEGDYVGKDDFVVFLPALYSVNINVTASGAEISATWRQIADVNGNLVNPTGFSFT